jgi:hypothetical protein
MVSAMVADAAEARILELAFAQISPEMTVFG